MSKDPAKFDQLTSRALARPELMRRLLGVQAVRKWSEAVGELLASKSAPERVEKGVLWVVAESSSWAQEMRMHSQEILAKLNGISPETFSSLRVRVGRIERGGTDDELIVPDPIEPDDLDIETENAVMRRALGRLRAASRRQDG